MIPLVDLAAQHRSIRTELDAAIAAVIDSSAFIRGPQVSAFEEHFAATCGTRFAVGTSSGTSAIQLVLEALNIGPGDEVIAPAHTFIATVEPIVQLGARVVFADVDPDYYTIDPAAVEPLITDRTRAIIAVHLYGQMADVDGLCSVIQRSGRSIHLIEDAAQAHGASRCGQRAGNVGVAGCFSFYPGKNLGALGDAGAVTTNDSALARRVRMLADHGRVGKYTHELIGTNHRMDAIQAAVLDVKLAHLDPWNRMRRSIAADYTRQLGNVTGVTTPSTAPDVEHVYHLYVLQVDDRDALRSALDAQGIRTGVHYPVALHQQPAMLNHGFGAGPLPVTERLVDRIVSIPMYPELTGAQVETVCKAIAESITQKEPLLA